MPIRRIVATVAVALCVVLLGGSLAPTAPAGAAGMTTHTWMADTATQRIETPALRALLLANLDYVKAGAKFPDGGYVSDNIHGEEAHWQRFVDVYVSLLRNKATCGDLSRPDGPCAGQIAHLFGIVAHGTGDEVWDWLFEPYSPDLDEYYTHPDLGLANEGGAELQLDLVAIGHYGRPADTLPPLTFGDDLITSLALAGVPGVTQQQLDLGQTVFSLLHAVEAQWATQHLDGVMTAMPWMSAHMVDGPGGVEWAARSIAGQWESLWTQLLGATVPTEVSNTYPASQERGVPATGWTRRPLPGSSRGRGGARTRIAASLTYSTPYRAPGGPGVSQTLPTGAMTLTVRDTGAVVPTMSGFPQSVPYTADSGEHTISIQPVGDLAPCTWHRVSVTGALLDARGTPVVPYSWTFRTGVDAAGTACADDPTGDTSISDYVARAYRDILGREATDSEIGFWIPLLEGGTEPEWLPALLLAFDEGKRATVAGVYREVLGRSPTTAEATAGAAQLQALGLVEYRARLLDSPEFAARSGGTVDGWLTLAVATTLGRPIDQPSLVFWGAYLRGGHSRLVLARLLTGGLEAHRVAVHRAYVDLVGTAPTDAWLATELAAGGDVRDSMIRIASRTPYLPDILATP